MIKKLTIFLFFIISTNVVAQNVTWEKFIPGRLYKDEWANDICQTTDGNFVVVGTAEGSFGDIVEAVKINGYGDTLWIKRYQTLDSIMYRGKGCCSSENGGSVITGLAGNENTAFLTKIDMNGDIIWVKEYSSFGITYDGLQVYKTFNGGYIVRGYDFIMKTDSLGNYKWHKHILDYGFSNFINLTISHTGEFLVIYDIISNPYERGVAKFNDDGNLIWKKAFTFTNNFAKVIKKLSSGYLLMGVFPGTPPNEPSYIFTYKMNEDGVFSSYTETIISKRRELFDGAANVINDNKFVFVTATQSMMDTQYCVFRLIDSSGNILKTNEIRTITDTSYYFKYKFIHSALPLTDGHIMFAGVGQIQFMGAAEDFYIVRADSNLFFQTVGVINNGSVIPERHKLYQNYPNPFNPVTTIKFDITKNTNVQLKIYDILGREIFTVVNEKLKAGSYTSVWDAVNYPSGVYFYKLIADEGFEVRQMMLVK